MVKILFLILIIGMGRFNRSVKNDLKNVLKNREERFRFFNTNTKSKTDYG
jgi:hypothetical protein